MWDVVVNRGNHLTPTLRAVKDNRTVKFNRKLQLRFKNLAHQWRNVLVFQAIQTNLANTQPRILKHPLSEHNHLIPHPPSLIPYNPRMHADKVATDQEFAHRRVAARHMAMRIRHLPNRSFNAILIDSVAMPAVIFE